MRILFLSAWHPFPPDNGARLRAFNILKGICDIHDVSLLTFADQDRLGNRSELESMCSKVTIIPKKDYASRSSRAIMGLFSSKPRVLVDRHVLEMERLVKIEISNGNHDLVIGTSIYMADYLNWEFKIPAILEELEVGVFTDAVKKSENLVKKARNQLTLTKLMLYLQNLLPHFHSCTVVSEEERELLSELVPEYDNFEVIPNGVSLENYQDVQNVPQPGKIIFTGALTFDPNFHAMEWFSRHVFPEVMQKNPEVELVITGSQGDRNLSNESRVKYTGYIDDIRPLIASAWISIAPIFSGGGTRLKILEAFGLRTPVIATSKGAEGLEVEHEKHLLIADTVEAFAMETDRLLNDVDLRTKLTSNAYQLVRENYDWPVIIPKLLSLIEDSTRIRETGMPKI
jgi:glycosyltransferase involved in cell wall biosynthesis